MVNLTFIAHGTATELQARVDARWPLGPMVYHWVRQHVPRSPLEMQPYQACALYGLAQAYDGGHIVEIGCGLGFSAGMLAWGAPNAVITSVDIDPEHVQTARASLAAYPHVTVMQGDSHDAALRDGLGPLDMVFVDGDHGPEMVRDLAWFNVLRPGGLLLVHDFNYQSAQHFPDVVWGVMGFLRTIGRAQPDVLLMECWGNKGPRGLVGVVRREGERVPCD